jgi:predicted MFS family arabinose efflux permease
VQHRTEAIMNAVTNAAADHPPRSSATVGSALALCGVTIAMMSCFYLMFSAAPAHAASLGGSRAAGFATAILMAATIIGELSAPRLIALAGRRAVMAAALPLLALPCLVTFSSDLAIVLVACAARGIGLGTVLVAAGGLAMSLAPAGKQAEFLGIYGVASALPAIAGVPLGPWALEHVGPNVTAVVATVIGLASLLGLTAFPRRTCSDVTKAQNSRTPNMHSLVWPVAALVAGAAVIGASVTLVPLTHGAIGAPMITSAFFLQGLGAALARWACGRWVDRRGPNAALLTGVALSVAGMLSLSLPGAGMVLAATTVSGAAFGILQCASLAQLMNAASPAHTDRLSAFWNVAYDTGLGLGGLGLGLLAATVGYEAGFVLSAAGLAIVLLFAFGISTSAAARRKGIPCCDPI